MKFSLWQLFRKMELIKEKFTTTGVHLLIAMKTNGSRSASSNMLDRDWSEYQVTCAKLTDQVKRILPVLKEQSRKLEAVVAAFKASPRFIANLEQQ